MCVIYLIKSLVRIHIKKNMEDVTNYVGNDTIGLCLNNTYDTKINNVSIKNIFSQKGTAYGTIVMNHSKHINIQGVQINMNESLEKHNKISIWYCHSRQFRECQSEALDKFTFVVNQ